MRVRPVAAAAVAAVLLSLASPVHAVDTWGLSSGDAQLKSAGPLAFGPDGILFIGDTKAATIFAIDTQDKTGDAAAVKLNVAGLDQRIADALGASSSTVQINDLAVNPTSGNVYLSASLGDEAKPAIIRVNGSGKIEQVGLKKVNFSSVALPNPPADKVVGEGRRRGNLRNDSITDLAFVEGKLFVSGLSDGQASSTVRELAFPFADADTGTNLEIFHGAHGKLEDHAAVRTFVPLVIDGEPNLLAGFVCTPLVKFPIKSLESGKKVRGTTVAELGNQNRPLDMIVYKKDGKNFLLMANSARGVMKISTEDIDRKQGIDQRVEGTAGQKYETIKDLEGVVQLDRLNDTTAVLLVNANGKLSLKTVALP